jgi:orotate phosphoribosyltransferase-like protein
MILPINDDYRIATDTCAWMIQQRQKRKRKGKQVWEWRAIKWFSTLQQAVQGFADLMLMSSDAKTLAEALAEVESVVATLSEALHPQFEVTPNLTWKQVKDDAA